jgi:acetyl esterase/lipase
MSEIDDIRALLGAKPRPIGWDARRARLDEVGTAWPPADDIAFRSVDIGGIGAEWSIAPGSAAGRVLIYFHGGGYCSGSVASHRRLVSEAGRAAGVSTLAVGYRLAPEHPFPAAIEDAEAAWRHVVSQGVAPSNIAIGGDSAGGGLTAVLINRLRELGQKGPACAWLISPWTDLTMSGASLTAKNDADPLIHAPYLAELADAYVPAGMDRADPRVSPLFSDLHGFPPVLIQVGSEETLLDDAVRFAGAAGAAQVPATLEVWPRMIHAWPLWNAHLADGRKALASAGFFIRRTLDAAV